MNQETIDEIDRLLDKLNSDNFIEKDIVIDTLCDYVCYHSISPEYKNKIIENVIELFNPKNTYNLQESIFYLLGSVSAQGILREKILDLMLIHLSNPQAEFMEHAVDTLVADWPSCYKKSEFKESIEQCLKSEDPDVRRVILVIIEDYEKQGISLID